VKFVMDALTGVLYTDDSQIVALQALKMYGADVDSCGAIEILLEKLEGSDVALLFHQMFPSEQQLELGTVANIESQISILGATSNKAVIEEAKEHEGFSGDIRCTQMYESGRVRRDKRMTVPSVHPQSASRYLDRICLISPSEKRHSLRRWDTG